MLLLLLTAGAVAFGPSEAGLSFSQTVAGGVLQYGESTAIWGSGATPNEAITIHLDTLPTPFSTTISADAHGNFSLKLPPQPISWNVLLSATSTASTGTAAAASATANTNVSFGIVVMCAGQSNMDMPVACHLTNQSLCGPPGSAKPIFTADNGTAEVAAAGRYTNKIFMIKAVSSKYEVRNKPHWQTASADPGGTAYPASYSAVCWYTGKALFEQLGGNTPVGLLQTSVGGSPIEYWLPPSLHPGGVPSPVNTNACESDTPQCDNMLNDSTFFEDIVEQLVPYTFGAMVWDQAERDVKCPVSTASYACMQSLLTSSWRNWFDSPNAAFVAVQLPGYTAALVNGTGSYGTLITAEMVFNMRLQQAAATTTSANASYVATYDLSCSDPVHCPYGSVHNVQKGPIGDRIANQLLNFFTRDESSSGNGGSSSSSSNMVTAGPHATSAAVTRKGAAGVFDVAVTFAGNASPFRLGGTKNCTHCCDGSAPTGKATDGHTLDFDVSGSGSGVGSENGGSAAWVNSTSAVLNISSGVVTFTVALPLGQMPKVVRYTASSMFPECALRNAAGLPALPFTLPIDDGVGSGVIS